MTTNASTRAVDRPLTFGLVVSSRAFFNPAHASGARAGLTAALETQGLGYAMPASRPGSNGPTLPTRSRA